MRKRVCAAHNPAAKFGNSWSRPRATRGKKESRVGHTCNNPCARKPANHITQRVERHFGQSGLSPPARIAIWPAGETPVREVEKAVFCLKPTKKADVLRAARRRLLLFTPGGQFPNQAEKLREPDSNRRPRGYEPRELPGCSIPRRK